MGGGNNMMLMSGGMGQNSNLNQSYNGLAGGKLSTHQTALLTDQN